MMLKTYIIKSENISPRIQRGTIVVFKKVGNRKEQADNTNSETLLTIK